MAKTEDKIKVIQEDLDNNPKLAEQGVKVGDKVSEAQVLEATAASIEETPEVQKEDPKQEETSGNDADVRKPEIILPGNTEPIAE